MGRRDSFVVIGKWDELRGCGEKYKGGGGFGIYIRSLWDILWEGDRIVYIKKRV